MQIKIGSYYVNKTWRVLFPAIRGHGPDFVTRFNPVFKLAVGVQDYLLKGSDFDTERCLFILCDKKYQTNNFNKFLEWVKFEPIYVTDYCPDANFTVSRRHMIVIKMPKDFYTAHDSFIKGEYSKMYTEEQIKALFSTEVRKNEKKILEKDLSYIPDFIREINKRFNTTLTTSDYDTGELELPPENIEEVFNFQKEGNYNHLIKTEI